MNYYLLLLRLLRLLYPYTLKLYRSHFAPSSEIVATHSVVKENIEDVNSSSSLSLSPAACNSFPPPSRPLPFPSSTKVEVFPSTTLPSQSKYLESTVRCLVTTLTNSPLLPPSEGNLDVVNVTSAKFSTNNCIVLRSLSSSSSNKSSTSASTPWSSVFSGAARAQPVTKATFSISFNLTRSRKSAFSLVLAANTSNESINILQLVASAFLTSGASPDTIFFSIRSYKPSKLDIELIFELFTVNAFSSSFSDPFSSSEKKSTGLDQQSTDSMPFLT
mmetsp:Transcript_1103/g.3269  ORF Transcript_1103/g.3269 Transcript_1103/m.3269 type:complete len:275 (+) Transcript_1103:525-1349(+)